MYLSNHDGESEYADKVVDELENILFQNGRFWKSTDSDQSLYSEIVTPDISAETNMNK